MHLQSSNIQHHKTQQSNNRHNQLNKQHADAKHAEVLEHLEKTDEKESSSKEQQTNKHGRNKRSNTARA